MKHIAKKNGSVAGNDNPANTLSKHAADFIALCASFAKALVLALVTLVRGIV